MYVIRRLKVKRGDFSTCVAPRPGRPKTVTIPEIIDQIHELILEDLRISYKTEISNHNTIIDYLNPYT
jgi:hypothetical protein